MKISQEKLKKYLEASVLCLELMDSDARSGNTFWEDEDGEGFSGDMGYLYEGLEAMRNYLEKKIGSTRDCKNCKNSSGGHITCSEECHECISISLL